VRGLRKRIFENMARSKQSAAHFTFVEECDVTALKDLRARLKEPAQKQGVNLTFLPFIVRAVVAALRRHPVLNGTFDEKTQEMVVKRYHNIGIATATEAGLVVPVVKTAGELSILELAREIERLAGDAREDEAKARRARRSDRHRRRDAPVAFVRSSPHRRARRCGVRVRAHRIPRAARDDVPRDDLTLRVDGPM
jgi:pyruvate/2-oxoglutarate dehydrogenase complex dihydrolipoamide acyltransferase (E2) component